MGRILTKPKWKGYRVLIPVFVIWFSLTFSITSEAQVLEIKYHEIEQLAEEYSIEWQQFDNRLGYEVAGEMQMATRLNPTLAYDLEYLNGQTQNEYEQYIYLSKEFRTPGHFRALREMRDIRIDGHFQEKERDRLEWLASSKYGFIQIVLLQEELAQMELLMHQLNLLREVSSLRSAEGEVSTLNHRLIDLGSYQLQSEIEERKGKLNRMTLLWKNRMGFKEEVELRFEGSFSTKPDTFIEMDRIVQLMDESPAAIADRLSAQSASLAISLENSRRFPSIEISAGYKQLNPNWNGFLVGVAIPLPILNTNREAIEQARALERVESSNLIKRQNERRYLAIELLNELRRSQDQLDRFPDYLHQPEAFMNTLLISYEEGTQSLNDFLNTIQLMVNNYQTKYDLLENAYGITLKLEAMTGHTVIQP